jgi:hypothetical protein
MVSADVSSNSSGELTATISPNLTTAIANDEAVTVNKPSFTVFLESDEIVFTTDSSNLYNISFGVREVIT